MEGEHGTEEEETGRQLLDGKGLRPGTHMLATHNYTKNPSGPVGNELDLMEGDTLVYLKVGQPPARGPDPAHEGLASGPPPCSAITLQSGPRNPSQTKAGFMSEITSRECTNSEHFGRNRDAHYGDC